MTLPRRAYWPDFRPFFEEIYARWPEAVDHDPCPCGLTMAIIPRDRVDPKLHYIVEDADLRERVRTVIIERGLLFSHCDGPDVVLVLCEMA